MKNMTKKNYKRGALVLATAVTLSNVVPSVANAVTVPSLENVSRGITNNFNYQFERVSDSTYQIKSVSNDGTVNKTKNVSVDGYSYFEVTGVFEVDSYYVIVTGSVSNDAGQTKQGVILRLNDSLSLNYSSIVPLSLSSNGRDSSITNVSISEINHMTISGPSLSSIEVLIPGFLEGTYTVDNAVIDGRQFYVAKDRAAGNYVIVENVDGLYVSKATFYSQETPITFVNGNDFYAANSLAGGISLVKYTVDGDSKLVIVSNEDCQRLDFPTLIDYDKGHVFVSSVSYATETIVTYLTEYDSDLNYVASYKFDSGNDWQIPTISSVSVTDKTLVLVLDGEVVEIDRKGLPSEDDSTETTPPVDSEEKPDGENPDDSEDGSTDGDSTGDDSNPVVPPSDDETGDSSNGEDSTVPPTGGDSSNGDESSNGDDSSNGGTTDEESPSDDSEETETSRTIYTFVDDSDNVYTVVVNNQTGEYSLIRKTADGTERVIYDFPIGYIAGFRFIDGELYYVGAGDSGYKVSRYVLEDESVSSTALGTDGIVDNFNVFTSDGSVFVAYSLFATRATEDAKIFVAELNQSDLSLLTTYDLTEPSNVGFIKNITADSNEVYVDYVLNGEDKTVSFQRFGADEDVPGEDEGTQTPPVENPGEDEGTQTPPTEDEGTQTPPTEDGDEGTQTPPTEEGDSTEEETPSEEEGDSTEEGDEVTPPTEEGDEVTPPTEEGESTEEGTQTPSDDESDKEESDKEESDKAESDKTESDKEESDKTEESVKVESTESATNSSNSTSQTLPQTGSVASVLTAVTGLVSSALGFVLTRKKND